MSAPLVGELALWVALLLAAWGTILSAAAGPLARDDLATSGGRGAHASAAFLGLAVLALWLSLLRTDLSLQYVARRGGFAATLLERTVAVWSAPAGALLVLALAVAVLTSVAVALARHAAAAESGGVSRASAWPAASTRLMRNGRASAPAAAATQLLLLGLVVTLVLAVRPFTRTTWAVSDGLGLPPAWRHPSMLAIWPLWAFGTAAAAAAFGLAIAASLRAAASGDSVREPRAADRTPAVPGTHPGGDPDLSAHDPVPRLLWSAADRWLLAAWVLVTAALVTALWWSYHTMQSLDGWLGRAIDPLTILAWLLLGAASLGRPRRLASPRARLIVATAPLLLLMSSSLLRSDASWDPLHELTRGTAAAWWIVTIAALVQVVVYAAVRLQPRDALGAENASRVARSPGGALGVRLMAVGAALTAAGIAATGLRVEHALELAPGQSATAQDVLGGERRVVFQGLSVRDVRDSLGAPRSREVLYPVAVGSGGTEIIVIAEVREYVDVLGRPVAPPRTYPGVHAGVARDIVVLADSVAEGERAFIRLAFVPLSGLIWLGGLTMLAGGVLAAARIGRMDA